MADSAAPVVGVNVTPIAHEADAARDAVQALVPPAAAGATAKSEAFVPDGVMGKVIAMAEPVLLVSVNVWVVLAVLMSWFPNASKHEASRPSSSVHGEESASTGTRVNLDTKAALRPAPTVV